ncbi:MULTISPECIES: GAF domain-containing protein [Catenuloplanes]|uniref:GAF domain-containing protein n=1 Tax=Catenuloplanes niger TaxID=587534 RepID=A0AAE4CTS3_9ACTN|nr:GAF domain-containing protein [Catenuloplanes niger]MDR7322588.1 GAF domain-containing protein [Catenuloplanes niger]
MGLPVQESVTGALNVYSTTAEAFDDSAVRMAASFAEYAAVALANAHLYDTTTTLTVRICSASVAVRS